MAIALDSATSDPAIDIPISMVFQFLRWWRHAEERSHTLVQQAWSSMVRSLVEKGRPWSRVNGPMAALYQTMKELKWNLFSPTCWVNSTGLRLRVD